MWMQKCFKVVSLWNVAVHGQLWFYWSAELHVNLCSSSLIVIAERSLVDVISSFFVSYGRFFQIPWSCWILLIVYENPQYLAIAFNILYTQKISWICCEYSQIRVVILNHVIIISNIVLASGGISCEYSRNSCYVLSM